MHEFIAKHQDKIAGTLSGFDRLVFRGHLRSIGHPQGMMTYLWFNQVLLKNFGDHVAEVTERLKEASLAEAKAYGRPVKYLNSSQTDKETIARDILAQDGVRAGLVCVLSCLTPKLFVLAGIHEFGTYRNIFAPLNNPPCDQRLHP